MAKYFSIVWGDLDWLEYWGCRTDQRKLSGSKTDQGFNINNPVSYVYGPDCLYSKKGLFPLDGCAWLRREVVANAVHIRNFCEDAVGDLHQDRPVDLFDACCHRVDGVHGADDHRPVVRTCVVAYSY